MNSVPDIPNSNIQVVQPLLTHQCSQYASAFEQSGPAKDKRDAASAMVELMSTAKIEEIQSCPTPNGFTLFHLIPMAEGADDATKSVLFERLVADKKMCTLINQPNDSIGIDQLWFKEDGRRMPLANGDRPSHIAVFAGSKEDVSRQLRALEQQGIKDCWSNNTGNNLFNIAAGRSLEIFDLVFDFYQPHEQFAKYITNCTNSLVTPTHHACRSTNADNLKILARLLVAGAEHNLSNEDNQDMTPLDHLIKKKGSYRQSQLMNFVEKDSRLLQMSEEAKAERLKTIELALSTAFDVANHKREMFTKIAHQRQTGVTP